MWLYDFWFLSGFGFIFILVSSCWFSPLFIHLRQSQHAQFKKSKTQKKGFLFWMLSLTLHSLLITYQYINQLYYIIHILLLCFLCIFRLFLFWICIHSNRDCLLRVEQKLCFPSVLFFFSFRLLYSGFLFGLRVWTWYAFPSVPGNAFLDDLIFNAFLVASIFILASRRSISVHSSKLASRAFRIQNEKTTHTSIHYSLYTDSFFLLELPQASQLILSIAVSPKNKTSSFISISAWNPKRNTLFMTIELVFQSIIDNRKTVTGAKV